MQRKQHLFGECAPFGYWQIQFVPSTIDSDILAPRRNRQVEASLKVVKWLTAIILISLLAYAAWVGITLFRLPSVTGLADRHLSLTIQVRDWQGKQHPFIVGPANPHWTPASRIPSEMEWAVIVSEDANFYQHEGIDVKAIKNAIKYDLEKKRFARGASTITQQTAKNLFLSREKTVTRKIEEFYLAKRMEQELTKERILELYLNIIELGPMVYGIDHGARYYFNKPASALTPRECSFLAAMLPGPQKVYNPYRHLDRVLKRSDTILRQLRQSGVLSEAEYRMALAETPDISGMQRKVDKSFTGKVRRFFKGLFSFS
ncbi:transglycosylase domain-containing protein [Geobacter pelophilus]|uniref:Transglycosylase domain-containing protein n=1 Tax=Geoanaerobacter pelophilus TaxID=60036 RepID=A0AAW4L2W3_9BACT|nr:transglycosylase domain-containing protein [Geoanaerobacter pelophilus]